MSHQTTLGGGITWHKEDNGTYTKVWNVYYKVYGKNIHHILEENINEKDYFKRRLDGTT